MKPGLRQPQIVCIPISHQIICSRYRRWLSVCCLHVSGFGGQNAGTVEVDGHINSTPEEKTF
jgi:hypothetical protein